MTGRLAGIARHHEPKGPMETVEAVTVSATEGVHGDFRGGMASTKPAFKAFALSGRLRTIRRPPALSGSEIFKLCRSLFRTAIP